MREFNIYVSGGTSYSIMQIANMVAQYVGWTGTIKWSGELSGIMDKSVNLTNCPLRFSDDLPKFLKPKTT